MTIEAATHTNPTESGIMFLCPQPCNVICSPNPDARI